MNASPVRNRAGYTLVEIGITLVILSIALLVAVPRLNRASENGELRDTALALDGAIENARSEAIRTGDIQLFFLFQDAEGNGLQDANGNPVPIAIVNDGAPGSPRQNCRIDPGEKVTTVGTAEDMKMADSVAPPPATAAANARDNGQGNAAANGSSFVDASGSEATWVMFRPDGSPVSFDANCNVGALGSGAGTFYLKNEDRAYAVSLSAMGTVAIARFNEATGLWE